MEQLVIRLRRRIFEMCVTIKCITSKFYTGGQNALLLLHGANAHLKKSTAVDAEKIYLSSSCKPSKEIFAGGTETSKLRTTIHDTHIKFDSCMENCVTLIEGTVLTLPTRYRELGEVDNDIDGAPFSLQNFDNMTLEDIDYVVL